MTFFLLPLFLTGMQSCWVELWGHHLATKRTNSASVYENGREEQEGAEGIEWYPASAAPPPIGPPVRTIFSSAGDVAGALLHVATHSL